MLLRCLRASGSFEEEWAALSGRHRQTGFRRGTKPGPTGSQSTCRPDGPLLRPNWKGTAHFWLVPTSRYDLIRLLLI